MASQGHEASRMEARGWGSSSPTAQDMLGRRLKAHYEQLEHQPLPENLQDLLRRLDESDGQSRTG